MGRNGDPHDLDAQLGRTVAPPRTARAGPAGRAYSWLLPPPAGAATKDAHPEIVQCYNDFDAPGLRRHDAGWLHPRRRRDPGERGAASYLLGTDGTVTIVDRAANGVLTPRTGAGSCFNDFGDNGCTQVDGLGANATDLALSDDGASVYVASSGAVASLARNVTTGDLTPSTCYSSGSPGCTVVAQLLGNVSAVAVSPASATNVYVRSNGRLLAFDRTAATGLLTLKAGNAGLLHRGPDGQGAANKVGLVGGGVETAVSPDGGSLYVPNDGGIAVFSRIAGGALDQVARTADGGCITVGGASTGANECQDAGGPGGAIELAEGTPRSRRRASYVFVSGNDGSRSVRPQRRRTGLLTLTRLPVASRTACLGVEDGDGVAGGPVSQLSPDGTRAIVGGGDVGGFGVFDFDEATGRFAQLPGCRGLLLGQRC